MPTSAGRVTSPTLTQRKRPTAVCRWPFLFLVKKHPTNFRMQLEDELRHHLKLPTSAAEDPRVKEVR